jgi:hypothetical protein
MRKIVEIQQTNEPILANFIHIEPQTVGDVIYFNWVLYNDNTYINNGNFIIFGENIDLYNSDEDWMYNYVGTQLNLVYRD